jgi:pimeloyl-ACP methyl ester carboxylesterase
MGEGTPAVILESGLGDSYISWRKAQPLVAKFTRVCSYDRAGIGYSDSSPQPRTSQRFAEELYQLLQSAQITPPYVLVGHSLGGFDIRIFASQHASETAGLVLVDSSHPDQQNRLPAELKNMQATQLREFEFLQFTMPFGIPRLLGLCDDDPTARAAECNFHTFQESVKEMKAIPQSCRQTVAAGSLGNLPLIVLSHDPDRPSAEMPPDLAMPTNEAWEKMQEELAGLSTRGVQKIIRNSGHYIQIDQPAAVADAIHDIVAQVRDGSTSSPAQP